MRQKSLQKLASYAFINGIVLTRHQLECIQIAPPNNILNRRGQVLSEPVIVENLTDELVTTISMKLIQVGYAYIDKPFSRPTDLNSSPTSP